MGFLEKLKESIDKGQEKASKETPLEKAIKDAKIHPDAPPMVFGEEGHLRKIEYGSVIPAYSADIQKREEWEQKQMEKEEKKFDTQLEEEILPKVHRLGDNSQELFKQEREKKIEKELEEDTKKE